MTSENGSWQLIQTLLSQELIDEFRLWIFPVVVDPGKRLFGQSTVPTDLALVKTKTTSNGVMMSLQARGQDPLHRKLMIWQGCPVNSLYHGVPRNAFIYVE